MPGSVETAVASVVLPRALCAVFSMELEFASLNSAYASGEYQLGLLVQNERRMWRQQRKLTHSEADALMAFYAARGGPAGVFWFYDPLESAGQPGSNWDSTGVQTNGRYAVRFNGGMTQSMPAPGRLAHDFSLIEVAAGPPIIAATLSFDTSFTQAATGVGAASNGSGYLLFSNDSYDRQILTSTWDGTTHQWSASVGPLLGMANPTKLQLQLFIFSSIGASPGPVASMQVYDVYMDVTFPGGGTLRLRPRIATILAGAGTITDKAFAIDSDPSTFAVISRSTYGFGGGSLLLSSFG